MKKRIYFNKLKEMKFISHLDLLRFFERIILKSGIPVKYSQGFHPRPKLSFGNPVSLGTEAYGEIMDIELEKDMSNQEVLERLNSFEVIGFQVLNVEEVHDKISIVDRFRVSIYEVSGEISLMEKLEKLLNQDEIIEVKEKKGKKIERDLKIKIKKVERIAPTAILIDIENGSPNSYLDFVEIQPQEVIITKRGYRKEE